MHVEINAASQFLKQADLNVVSRIAVQNFPQDNT